MSKRHFLDFEQPIAELDSKIEELRYVQNESAVDISDEIDQLARFLSGNLYRKRSNHCKAVLAWIVVSAKRSVK